MVWVWGGACGLGMRLRAFHISSVVGCGIGQRFGYEVVVKIYLGMNCYTSLCKGYLVVCSFGYGLYWCIPVGTGVSVICTGWGIRLLN